MIRAIIFDCFGVLYVDASRYFYEHAVPNSDRLTPELLSLNKAWDYGLIDRNEWLDSIAELTGLDREYVKTNVSGDHKRNQKLLDYAESLRQQFKLGMCSNIGPDGMDEYFSKHEREKLFDTVVLSGEEGVTKPNPEIFRLVAERLGVRPDECVMIDDIEENCSGADAAGMQTIVYHTNRQLKNDLQKLTKLD